MSRQTQITLTVTVQFNEEETNPEMVASDLAWSLIEEFGVHNDWNAARDDQMVVLYVGSAEKTV